MERREKEREGSKKTWHNIYGKVRTFHLGVTVRTTRREGFCECGSSSRQLPCTIIRTSYGAHASGFLLLMTFKYRLLSHAHGWSVPRNLGYSVYSTYPRVLSRLPAACPVSRPPTRSLDGNFCAPQPSFYSFKISTTAYIHHYTAVLPRPAARHNGIRPPTLIECARETKPRPNEHDRTGHCAVRAIATAILCMAPSTFRLRH